MNRDEQRKITEFIDRAVSSCPAAPLLPMDIEADAIIRALFVRNPEAAYRVTMLAIDQARQLAVGCALAEDNDPDAPAGLLARLFNKRQPRRRLDPDFQRLQRSVSG